MTSSISGNPPDKSVVILHVEDYAPSRFLRSRVLRNAGFEVVEADSAESAMQVAAARPPQLALVDVDLPDGNGFTLCGGLKAAYPSLPVLLISAVHISAWDRDTAFDTGAEAYLVEPVPPDTLLRQVGQALRGLLREASQTWVETNSTGIIDDATPAAGHMLGVGVKHLRGRSLLVFFAQDRDEWNRALGAAIRGQIVRRTGVVRPRDRRPVNVEVEIAAVPIALGTSGFRWIFTVPQDS